MNGIDERGDLKDWCGLARVESKWIKIVKDRILVEKGGFEETNDEPIESDNINANRDESTKTPRQKPSNSNGRWRTSPNRGIVEPVSMSRR